MTTPTLDDFVQGATKHLLAQPTLLAALGRTPGGTPMLFQHQLYAPVEGTSASALVVSSGGSWAAANTYNTVRFPRLHIEMYCDPKRDMGRNTVDPGEVYRRVDSLFGILDRILHRPQGGTQMWGTVRTISCVRAVEPRPYRVPDGDGLMRAEIFYSVEMG